MIKDGLSTAEAIAQVSRALRTPRLSIGVAGLKDKNAVTEQWISVPTRVARRVDGFRHAAIRLHRGDEHGQKLRRGHLRGNRFAVVVRNPSVDLDEALVRIERKHQALTAGGGLWNLYGEQRFGPRGRNLAPAFAKLTGRSGRRDAFLLSCAQSALFNLYLLERIRRDLLRTVLEGDVLQKVDTGGMFECTDPAVDQQRLDAKELVITGPMFGSRMRGPAVCTPSFELESEVLAAVGLDPAVFQGLGKSAPGSRRPLQVAVETIETTFAEALPDEGLPSGVCLSFTLPAGSYATQLLRELQGGPVSKERA
jgi:tRNA pseudouridine13 synthase